MNRTVGLTDADIQERQRDGRVNRTAFATKSVLHILSDNLFTPFNAINTILAAALFLVGSYHNLLFFGVVISNATIGILQEIRARRTLSKLSLLHTAGVRVRRNGRIQTIPASALVEDDCLLLQSGDRLPADATLLDGQLEADESLLTGEAVSVRKHVGDRLLSGSFVIGGHGEAVVTHVGSRAYAAKLTALARRFVRAPSPLTASINKILRFTGWFMLPFAALLSAKAFVAGGLSVRDTVTAVAAALLGMMPQGLILLTTASLTVGVIRLAEKRVLVQELHSPETLAGVSLLCLDKTGTITKGTLSVRRVLPLCDDADLALIGAAVHAIGDTNPTANALRRFFQNSDHYTPLDICPFSSTRQWSAVGFQAVGTIFFGAYEALFPHAPLPDALRAVTQNGDRLLITAFSQDPCPSTAQRLSPLAAIVLEDDLQNAVERVVTALQRERITVRVLSGDHPDTVAAVAAKAGIRGAHDAVDASTLTTPAALEQAAARYTVFGRVNPEQKQHLIRCFKAQGHTVAMMGDGVNDVPALKEADCSITMASGCDAAKRVSHLILLNNDFAALPAAFAESRRIVQNLTRTASLFLVKTVMSFLLTLCAVFLPIHYPFEPLQLTLIGTFAESLPAFLLTFIPVRERFSHDFLRTVLRRAVPSGVLIAVSVTVIQWAFPLSDAQSSVLCMYVAGLLWLLLLRRVCRPFAAIGKAVWLTMTSGFFGGAWVLSFVLPTVFATPSAATVSLFGAFALLLIPLDYTLSRFDE